MAGGSDPSRPRLAARLLATAVLAQTSACGSGARDLSGEQLAARVEARLEREKAALVEDLGHYALVFPVEQSELLAFMRRILVFGDVHELVLGTAQGFEPHGGGLLALLLEQWKPQGRAAELGDRFAFQAGGASLPLSAVYASHQRQIFLPEGGDAPQLARMRFRVTGAPEVEADAYQFLGVLIAEEPDLEKSWPNARGQRLSAAVLLDHARRHYLAGGDSASEPADHSELHLVELLLAASRRQRWDPEEIQRRFFAVELQRREFDPADEAQLLGHYAESLGRLLADPRVAWSAREKDVAREWLRWLEDEHFRELDGIPPRHLTHLLLGLRLAHEHRQRLE